MSNFENHLMNLLEFAEVEISRQVNGEFFVSVKPKNFGSLWWYACDHDLYRAIDLCREKAIALKFISDIWIDWNGGECPVVPTTRVEYMTRSGIKNIAPAQILWWGRFEKDENFDIVKYRVISKRYKNV